MNSKKSILFVLFTTLLIAILCCLSENKKNDQYLSVEKTSARLLFEKEISEASLILKEGDLVVRSGNEFSSQIIRQFCKTDKSFSHAGVVFFEDGHPMVYHILTGDQNPDEKLKKDSLNVFCNPRKNFGFGIYRYDLDPGEIIKFRKTIKHWYEMQIKFDGAFDLISDDRMYCSEMIRKGLKIATKNRLLVQTTRPSYKESEFYSHVFNIPSSAIAGKEFIAIDNLYIHPLCRMVKRFEFKTEHVKG